MTTETKAKYCGVGSFVFGISLVCIGFMLPDTMCLMIGVLCMVLVPVPPADYSDFN